jgi:16S rRNA (guanine527-N7)-methyltransferase
MSDEADFREALLRAANCLGVSLDDSALSLMYSHFQLVVEANKQFNLTRITDPADAAVKLFADSLAPAAWADATGVQVERLLDVGSGAGFPAVPIAITRQGWRVTAIDSVGKKARFVADCAARLPLANLEVRQARAGQWKAPLQFDLITFKAVGKLDACVEQAKSLVSRGGHVAFFKSAGVSRQELDAGSRAGERCGFTLWDTFDYDLPLLEERLEMSLILFRRTS